MSKNKIISLVVIAVVIIGIAFYVGTKFGGSSTQTGPGNFNRSAMGTSTKGRSSFGGAVTGQILSVDTNSLTISSQTGGSRIVFLGASTTISKMSTGSITDLTVGSSVSVNGTNNTDNSINAQMVQIRPTPSVKQ
jgi:hypothetical protein